MPKAPAKKPGEIINALGNLNFIDEEDCWLPYDDGVWNEAVNLLENRMSKAYVYIYITGNRNLVSDGIHKRDCSKIKKLKNDSNKKRLDDLNFSNQSSQNILSPLVGSIHLSVEQWESLNAQLKVYNCREYEVLDKGWTDKMYDFLWKTYHLPCPFVFKNSKINRNPGQIFLQIKGFCNECQTPIVIQSLNEPTAEGMELQISTNDTKDVMHKKKRQLRGPLRDQIAENILSKGTYNFRRNAADEYMVFEGMEPANLYSDDVLRKAKQEKIDRDLGVGPVADIVQAVVELKTRSEFAGSIHEVAADKFYVMYWRPEQIALWNICLRKTSGIMSVDASGLSIKPLPTKDGSNNILFLYQAVSSYNGNTLPCFQMISAKHDANTLQYWLREFLRMGGNRPNQVVIDYSLALLNAASLAYNDRRLDHYVEDCLIQATSKHATTKKMCIIRIDIAHLIHFVTKWSCFKNYKLSVKDFYTRCIGLLSYVTTVEEFCDMLLDILIVANCEKEEICKTNRCHVSLTRLLHLLKTYEPFPRRSDDDSFIEVPDLEDEEEPSNIALENKISQLLKTINEKAVSDGSGDRDNGYECRPLVARLLKFSQHFILWTDIMGHRYYGDKPKMFNDLHASSSARSEQYFRDTKSYILQKKKSLRVDKVLITHLRSLSGTVKLLSSRNADARFTCKDSELKTHEKDQFQKKNAMSDSEAALLETSEVQTTSLESVVHDIEPYVSERVLRDDNQSPKIISESSSENNSEGINTPQKINFVLTPDMYDFQASHDNDSPVIMKPKFSSTGIESNFEQSFIKAAESEDTNTTINESTHSNANVLQDKTNYSYLNKEDSWRGCLKSPIKKRGKFLEPYVEIENIHNRPRFKKNISLLVNGNSQGLVKTKKKGTVKVMNTCSFDAMIHSIVIGYTEWNEYNDFVNKSSNEILKFVRTLASQGTTKNSYEERADLMIDAGSKIDDNIVDFEKNVDSIIDHFFNDEPSFKYYRSCIKCNTKSTKKSAAAIQINLKPIYSRGLQGLEESLEIFDKYMKKHRCKHCGIEKSVKYIEGGHLFVDIESLSWKNNARRSGVDKSYKKNFTLKSVPIDITFKNYQYKLAAVIAHLPPDGGIGHYQCYARRSTGVWELRDGITNRSKPKKITINMHKEEHSIHILFYVRNSAK